jgi:P-type Ca2+ transporter type 2C
MGITGSEVAKEAAHMILLDDNYATIVRAIEEGRRIYDNILKFIKYLVTTNSGELLILMLGPLLGLPIALVPIQILWINLVTDGLPAIALTYERAEKGIMKRPPRSSGESVFSGGRGMQIFRSGLLMTMVTLVAQWFAIEKGLHWQTITFNLICFIQMAIVLSLRSEYQSLFRIGIWSNKPLFVSVLISILLQTMVTYLPFLQSIFKTESLSLAEYLGVCVLASAICVTMEIDKVIRRRVSQLTGIRFQGLRFM